jgi:hypothetical protein
MINRTVRRVALGATVTATLFTGLASTVHADTCVQVDDTFQKFAPTGDLRLTEVCSVVNTLRPLDPSTTSGRGYWLDDGTVLWLSDAEWWELLDKAVADEAWQDANHDLLVAVGILTCRLEPVSTITSIEITKQYQFCPPTWDPYERPTWDLYERPR